jgi:DNA-binding LacI/PurR family transcriptional regulator/biotin operon repressor
MQTTTPKYILVEKYIKQAIQQRQLTDKLPGERGLADELGVSYMTVRKGIENLVQQGILYKVPTKGTYVNIHQKNKTQTRTIGYFLDSSIKSGISSPYYSLVFHAIEKEASKHGYSVVYFSERNNNKLQATLQKLDGVIATCFPRIEKTIQLIKQAVPVVVIDNSAADKSIPSVIIDNFNADVQSVDYICSLGHRSIGFMMGLEDSDIGNSRYAGYLHGLSQHGIQPDEKLVFKGNYSYASGLQGAKYFLSLKRPPTAIICANDSMALGTLKGLSKHGIAVPGQMSVIGFDDIEVASQIIPPLTTVAAPIGDIAKQAFAALGRLIQGEQPEYQHIALAPKLVIRETCQALNEQAVA